MKSSKEKAFANLTLGTAIYLLDSMRNRMGGTVTIFFEEPMIFGPELRILMKPRPTALAEPPMSFAAKMAAISWEPPVPPFWVWVLASASVCCWRQQAEKKPATIWPIRREISATASPLGVGATGTYGC